MKTIILEILEELGEEQFESLKLLLSEKIPKHYLEKATRCQTVDGIVEKYGQQSVEELKKILVKIHRNDLVEKLQSTGAESTVAVSHLERSPAAEEALLKDRPTQRVLPQQQPLVSASNEAKISTVSGNYEDIISRSSQVRSGSPAVYQLRPERKQFGNVSRLTVGKQDVKKVNKTILLVGETGAGKSSLINALVNHAMGVRFEDDIWFQIVEEEKNSQTDSQTSDVIVYDIFDFKENTLPFSLTIIDTPGFGDTKKHEQDLMISQRLLDLFRSHEGVHEINLVGLVLQAGVNRLSDRLMYVFDSVMSLFGKNMENNIVALITHSDGGTPKNALDALKAAKIKCARNEENEPVHFLFSNRQSEERAGKDKNKNALERAWQDSEEGTGEFIDFLRNCKAQNLMTTVDVLKERVRLTACIQNLQERIKRIELKHEKIQQNQDVLKKHEEEMKKNKNFIIKVDEVYKEIEHIEGGMWGLLFYAGAVTCNICQENCHYPCTMAVEPEQCEVMRGGRCTSCTNKCPASDHMKEKKIWKTKTRKVQKTEEQMKEKYEQDKAEHEKKLSLLENLAEEMKTLTKKKTQLLEEAYNHVLRLEEIALNVNSLSTYVHLDFLIEKMKEEGDGEKVQRLEKMKEQIEADERARGALMYMKNKMIN